MTNDADMQEPGHAPSTDLSLLGIAEAHLPVRRYGYCVVCNRLVELGHEGDCSAGHPAEAVTGALLSFEGDEPPRLPAFNIAAFVMPPLWGPVHGQWAGAFFLPIWLFADSVVVNAIRGGGGQRMAAAIVIAATLAFQAIFARRASGMAFRRVIDHVSLEDFRRRQRLWAIGAVPIAIALLMWAIWFDLARR